VRSDVALSHFPDEVFPHTLGHREYVENLRNSHVVVSTNGLEGCPSWRTAEALAAGAILVTETPVNLVNEHLRPGTNVFFYDTPEECESICSSVLSSDSETLKRMHAAASGYYEQYVAPGPSLRKKVES
jgi:hypothetical protein